MTSFPQNLVLDSQPRFGFTPSDFLNLYNFLINYRIFMRIVAKCSAFLSLAYQVHVEVCNPIPLSNSTLPPLFGYKMGMKETIRLRRLYTVQLLEGISLKQNQLIIPVLINSKILRVI